MCLLLTQSSENGRSGNFPLPEAGFQDFREILVSGTKNDQIEARESEIGGKLQTSDVIPAG